MSHSASPAASDLELSVDLCTHISMEEVYIVCVLCVCHAVGAEVVLGGAGHWVVSTGTQTGEQTSNVQITVPLQQVAI